MACRIGVAWSDPGRCGQSNGDGQGRRDLTRQIGTVRIDTVWSVKVARIGVTGHVEPNRSGVACSGLSNWPGQERYR